jgi:uncharacterized protein YecE (DUF72 family)
MSGFSYPEWVGDFYPKGTKREGMLAYYSTRFGAVEINMSFRRDLPESTVLRWRDAVDRPDFRFTAKAHARITHFRRLVDTDDAVEKFVRSVVPLGERLGPILFQVHPNLKFDRDVLETFCASLPRDRAYVFEARNDSFVGDAVDDVLRRYGIGRCLNDDLYEPSTYTLTAPLAYFRFHREKPYDAAELQARADLLVSIADRDADVYAFFSHEDNPESVHPALRVQEIVTR